MIYTIMVSSTWMYASSLGSPDVYPSLITPEVSMFKKADTPPSETNFAIFRPGLKPAGSVATATGTLIDLGSENAIETDNIWLVFRTVWVPLLIRPLDGSRSKLVSVLPFNCTIYLLTIINQHVNIISKS